MSSVLQEGADGVTREERGERERERERERETFGPSSERHLFPHTPRIFMPCFPQLTFPGNFGITLSAHCPTCKA